MPDETPVSHPTGNESLPGLTQPTNATVEAARKAVDQTPAVELNRHGKPKGQPGRPIKSGKWAKPRPGVPVGKMVDRPGPLLLEDEIKSIPEAASLPVDFDPGPLAFDKAKMEPYADGLIDLASELNGVFVMGQIARGTKDKALAELIGSKLAMGDTERKLMRVGLIDCAEKYQVDLSKSPEAALIGGLVLWQLKTQAMVRSVITDYRKSNPA